MKQTQKNRLRKAIELLEEASEIMEAVETELLTKVDQTEGEALGEMGLNLLSVIEDINEQFLD